jgi:hypothetical protein
MTKLLSRNVGNTKIAVRTVKLYKTGPLRANRVEVPLGKRSIGSLDLQCMVLYRL